MEDQDKLYEQFRGAAEKSESQGFARMEAVWNRVEDKLDNKKQRKIAAWWKYTGMAAILLLFVTVGTFLYTNESPSVTPQGTQENSITVIDTQKIKNSADALKENPIVQDNTVKNDNALGEEAAVNEEVVVNDQHPAGIEGRMTEAAPANFKPVAEKASVLNSNSNIGTPIGYSNSASSAFSETYTRDKYYQTTKEVPANINGTINFSGTVVDSQGMPIPGVTISDGKGKNVQTDFDGRYTININEGDKLSASYIGMRNNTLLGWMGNNNTTLQMADDTVALNEVVVTDSGRKAKSVANNAIKSIPSELIDEKATKEYDPTVNGTVASIDEGKVKKRVYTERSDKGEFVARGELTGNADDKDSDVLEKNEVLGKKAAEVKPNANILPILQGEGAGLNIATGSGQPGPSSTIVMRGVGSINGNIAPLYVVDGVPMSADEFKKVNSDDIVEITILKDASATSIYGNRGVNGVIVIKTKNAKPLTKRQLREQEKKLKEQMKEDEKQMKDSINTKEKN
jgi:Ca-activated chloride channel homolog